MTNNDMFKRLMKEPKKVLAGYIANRSLFDSEQFESYAKQYRINKLFKMIMDRMPNDDPVIVETWI
ncbi:MAG: hypothetical protein PWQ97_477 [Tepidanaerobacteraceae bacterium]|nr:hypothetical protein [Tepidanaerobacteraceae bacterium]